MIAEFLGEMKMAASVYRSLQNLQNSSIFAIIRIMVYLIRIKPRAYKNLKNLVAEDLMDLRDAKKKEAKKPTLTLNQVKSKLKTAKPVLKKRSLR